MNFWMNNLKIWIVILVSLIVVGKTQFCSASELDEFYEQMQFLTEKDRVISKNIANADTPNYKPKELKRKPKNEEVVKLKRTNPMHFDVEEGMGNFELSNAEIEELKPNGNAVNLDRELFNKGNNALDLQQSTNLYNKTKNLMKYAIEGAK